MRKINEGCFAAVAANMKAWLFAASAMASSCLAAALLSYHMWRRRGGVACICLPHTAPVSVMWRHGAASMFCLATSVA